MAIADLLPIFTACLARNRAFYLTVLLLNISDTVKLEPGNASATARSLLFSLLSAYRRGYATSSCLPR